MSPPNHLSTTTSKRKPPFQRSVRRARAPAEQTAGSTRHSVGVRCPPACAPPPPPPLPLSRAEPPQKPHAPQAQKVQSEALSTSAHQSSQRCSVEPSSAARHARAPRSSAAAQSSRSAPAAQEAIIARRAARPALLSLTVGTHFQQ
eukprot:scaffold288066_cov30-Tisochrysis_lutea.AAC.3